jgi:hypothetical protein
MIHRGDVLARITADLKAGIRRITGQPDHYMNKMSSARVERALREGKRLPPENLLLVGCGFAMAPLCTLQSRPEFIGFVTDPSAPAPRIGTRLNRFEPEQRWRLHTNDP